MRSRQQLAELRFHCTVVAFAKHFHDNRALRVYQKAIGPSLDSIRLPCGVVLVSDNRPGQPEPLSRRADVVDIEPDIEFAVVNANDFEAVGMVFDVPALEYAEVTNAIDAGVLPEINEHDLAAIAGDMVGSGRTLVEPDATRAEIGRPKFFLICLSEGRDRKTDQEREDSQGYSQRFIFWGADRHGTLLSMPDANIVFNYRHWIRPNCEMSA